MTSRRYKQGVDRHQASLLPPSVEEYVDKNNPVRAIDYFVSSIDLGAQGFTNTSGVTAGQPSYAPSTLLKLYLYGYQNRVRSSRRLEAEAHRNLELIWLLEGLKPSYKTISDFRKDNGKALKKACREFVLICKELGLLGGKTVAVDGSFFKGNASKKSIATKSKLKKRIKKTDEKVEKYLELLQKQDKEDDGNALGSLVLDENLQEKLNQIESKKKELEAELAALEESGETQVSSTDKDARLLYKRSTSVAGYNVQQSVDAENKLIVTHEVTNEGNDNQQLAPQALESKKILGSSELTVLGDSGYYNSEQIKECIDNQILPYVAIPDKSKVIRDEGRFTRDQFIFDKENNHYVCPNGEVLPQIGNPYLKRGSKMLKYSSRKSQCAECTLKQACLSKEAPFRQIIRWEHEEVVEAHQERMKDSKEMMVQRAALAEHPFGTMKRWCGWDHFLVRGFEKVSGEMSLMVLSYNFTRMINIIGVDKFKAYCQERMQLLNASNKMMREA